MKAAKKSIYTLCLLSIVSIIICLLILFLPRSITRYLDLKTEDIQEIYLMRFNQRIPIDELNIKKVIESIKEVNIIVNFQNKRIEASNYLFIVTNHTTYIINEYEIRDSNNGDNSICYYKNKAINKIIEELSTI